ncbi:DUF1398 family protein, partial [Escherichia coli]|uniref:DUF1398 family protein n=1 Tax=Escherichia coli TaxID=562 RepID=UPI000A6D8416
MDQVVVFQKMFEQVRKEQNFSWFYSELKHHRIAHYIYYLATDNGFAPIFPDTCYHLTHYWLAA